MAREIGVGGFSVSPLARRYVNEVLDSNRLTYGPFHRRFEAAFAAEHAFMLSGLVLKNEDKAPLVNYLEDHGVETRDLLPLLNQPVYRRIFGDLEPLFPVAKSLNRSAFYIGCHQYMTPDDADSVVEQFRAFFRSR